MRPPQKAAATSPGNYKLLGFFPGWFRREGVGLFDEQHESGSVFHRDVGENFAVQFDSGGFQAVNQLTVGDAVQSRCGPDALNPQPAILPFFYAAVAKCIAVGAIRRLLVRTGTAYFW